MEKAWNLTTLISFALGTNYLPILYMESTKTAFSSAVHSGKRDCLYAGSASTGLPFSFISLVLFMLLAQCHFDTVVEGGS